MKTVQTFFATSIYSSKISFDLPGLVQEIEMIQKADKSGQKWSETNYHQGYTSYGSMDKLHHMSSTFAHLQNKIDRHISAYLKALDYQATAKNIKMTDCWVNIMPSGALHTAHIHPQSVISGTFYVSTPKGASPIKFEDPRMGLFMNSPSVKPQAKSHNKRSVTLEPRAGDVVLFESWIRHEVPANRSQKPRISVSFNYDWN